MSSRQLSLNHPARPQTHSDEELCVVQLLLRESSALPCSHTRGKDCFAATVCHSRQAVSRSSMRCSNRVDWQQQLHSAALVSLPHRYHNSSCPLIRMIAVVVLSPGLPPFVSCCTAICTSLQLLVCNAGTSGSGEGSKSILDNLMYVPSVVCAVLAAWQLDRRQQKVRLCRTLTAILA